MKLELKNIKHTEWASQETLCYEAALHVDGKPVALVSNDGHGGCDREYPHPKHKGDFRAAMAAVHAHFAALPIDDTYGISQHLEYWCADTVNDYLTARDLKKALRKKFLFTLKDRAGLYESKARPSPAEGVALLLNDAPFDDALAIYRNWQ
tara:strand:- start:76 stop:528 length:453 start_codon:yes stop_codon:yes gene_type:complete